MTKFESNNTQDIKQQLSKNAIVVVLMLIIALTHVINIKSFLFGKYFELFTSYYSDLVLPFGFYFLLCPSDQHIRIIRSWYAKTIIVFGLAAIAEILQYFGIYALGATFDPCDFVMYAVGVSLAAFVEIQIMRRIFPFWRNEEQNT